MALVINTNVMSLNAQRNLTTSGNQLAQSLQRLSSGLRINSAKDDAAGLAISERMTTQINGLGQAARNANDGISLAQTTEGALQEVTSNLQRIRELSVQAANATNSVDDLKALDQEVQQRIQEIDRIASQTSFNGRKVLDGSFGSATFQVGANVGETIAVGLSTSMKTSAIGELSSASSAGLNGLFASGAGLTLATGDLTVDGTSVAAGNYTTAAGLAAAINTAFTTSGGSGTLATVSGNEIAFSNASGAAVALAGAANPLGITTVAAQSTSGAGLTLAAGELSFNGTDVTGTFTDAGSLITAINAAAGSAVASANGNEITITNTSTATPVTVGGTGAAALGFSTVAAATPDSITLTGSGEFSIQYNAGAVIDVAAGTYNDTASLVAAINTASAAAGGSASFASLDGSGNLVLAADATNDYVIDGSLATSLVVNGTITGGGADSTSSSTLASQLTGGSDTTDDSNGVNTAVTNPGTTTPGAALTTIVNAAVTATGTPTPVTLAAGAFTVAVGSGTAVDLEGTYASGQELADAINSNVVGAFAQFNSETGVMTVTSGEALTLNGTAAGAGATNLGFGTVGSAIAVSGNLNSVNVLTKTGADDAILRMDAALSSVSTLRSTLGAIQNRFQSTINSLQAVSENLAASRSRIQDTDFAAETASLTRAQILQQAGTAMVAQANSAPQNVLSLLRG